MSQPLPTGGFKWLTADEINSLDINSVADDADDGYILEVDLGEFQFLISNELKPREKKSSIGV